MVEVVIALDAQKEFHALPKAIRARFEGLLQRLQSWPDVSGAKPLRGNLVGQYRLRTGDYRLQFRVVSNRSKADDEPEQTQKPDVVIVEKIGHRDRFYDE